ncbi:MAG: hypothetical protein LBE22_07185 [Azoarcus sp.]|jgi:hypothetical protein|nr:hypothetical protein [Azoarcus sp.]
MDVLAPALIINKLDPEQAERLSARSASGRETYLVDVEDESVSRIFENVMPFLGGLLSEKTANIRRRRLGELVDFMAAQLLRPSEADTKMAQRLAARRAEVLNEFGYFTAEQLADVNRSKAANRGALADNWRKRRQVFAVQHPDRSLRERDVYPAFQFSDHQPIKAVREVLEVFGEQKESWKLALWFTSNNGWLPDSARPVDLLGSCPEAVIEAARRDSVGSAA